MNTRIVTLDVREDIRDGREPFSKIMKAATTLGEDEALLLLAPFEPVPLFSVMGRRGFSYTAHATTSGDWEVIFIKRSVGQSDDTAQSPLCECCCNRVASSSAGTVDLDARGLEPPQPMVKILEALAALPDGAELRALTDRRPIHLYAQLEQRGFTAQTEEQSDGSFLTHIRRA
jgi:uncharacterized protein (DUF2249 family)